MNSLFLRSLIKSAYIFTARNLFKIKIRQGNIIAGKRKLSLNETNDLIKSKILSKEPFMVGRWGGCENDIIALHYLKKSHLIRKIPTRKFHYFTNNAGFYPNDISLIKKFVEIMEESASQINIVGAWNWLMEDYIIKTTAPQAAITSLGFLEPWYCENPWSKALEGKKVLVIHPFEQSIKSQYQKHDILFPNKNILPTFELKTYKPIQSIAGNRPIGLDTWFDALNYMTAQVERIDFEIAIIGCGAYGFPLAARIKQMGKQAIHLAGATQLLFGIKGSRWERGAYNDFFKNVFNENWIRPSDGEKPMGADSIEGACYW